MQITVAQLSSRVRELVVPSNESLRTNAIPVSHGLIGSLTSSPTTRGEYGWRQLCARKSFSAAWARTSMDRVGSPWWPQRLIMPVSNRSSSSRNSNCCVSPLRIASYCHWTAWTAVLRSCAEKSSAVGKSSDMVNFRSEHGPGQTGNGLVTALSRRSLSWPASPRPVLIPQTCP
jgi:hypothetical protein